MTNKTRPPNEVGPRENLGGTDNIHTNTAKHHQDGTVNCSGSPRPCPADTVPVQLRRRRGASWRLPVLDSGYSDPVQPWRPEQLSDKQIDGAAAAAAHLRAVGFAPLFDADTLKQLWGAA